jgi:hypothetical protein
MPSVLPTKLCQTFVLYTRTGVNIITFYVHIFHTKVLFSSYVLVKKALLYEKSACKMLMKLTTVRSAVCRPYEIFWTYGQHVINKLDSTVTFFTSNCAAKFTKTIAERKPLRAGFGPRVLLCPPLLYTLCHALKKSA